MAISIFLANSPPLHSFLSSYDSPLLRRVEPLRPCLSNVTLVARNATASAEIVSRPTWKKRKKKRVVFADARGLALTAVHVFNEAEDNLLSELQFHMTEIEGACSELPLVPREGARDCGPLILDFVQPAADYLDMRNRLKSQQVCLETCSIQDRMLSGTVQVRNVSFEKSVSMRISFDSWRSFKDVVGLYLNNIYGCPDIDTFSFSVLIPEVLEPSHRVEFCIRYQTHDQTFWDNNRGENYRLVVADTKGQPALNTQTTPSLKILGGCIGEKGSGIELDPFGSPRTSAGIFPEWQSWGHVEDSAPYW
ncbi:protein phosphatase 1 regulatory subunit 3C-B [Takifugu rubripes]|uniref:Protein phosphatase 1 regulatory subunit n=1 Tax=Takifugu rubripes TaxID=31033 RepID=A0A3B5K9J2_TAKRU|nr:protein phosphatase 1 regulatory subunit 3C-B-like [Takifugu rubripes]|eukprot:XP_011618450.1 PREDICTED: protein phosphatase 1 regulatory subunit 3C-B-like [Takifugu rubripes]